MNKCQPRYLWIVMKNNIWALLNDKYSDLVFISKDEDLKQAITHTIAKFDPTQIDNLI